MLHDHHRIALVPQPQEGVDEPPVVPGVQSHRGLVAYVQHSGEPAADLGRQPHALGFPARQRRRGAIQGQIVQSDVLESAQTAEDLLDGPLGDQPLPGRQRRAVGAVPGASAVFAVAGDAPEPPDGVPDGHARHGGDVPAADQRGPRFGAQPGAGAFPAPARGEITLDLAAAALGRRHFLVTDAQVVQRPAVIGPPPVVPRPASGGVPADFHGQPARHAVQDRLQSLRRQLLHRRMLRKVQRPAQRGGQRGRVPARGAPVAPGVLFAPGRHRAVRQGAAGVRDDQIRIRLHMMPQAGALGTGAADGIETEVAGLDFHHGVAAVRAGEMLAVDFLGVRAVGRSDQQSALAGAQRRLHRLDQTLRVIVLVLGPDGQPVHHNVNVVLFAPVQRQRRFVVQTRQRAVNARPDISFPAGRGQDFPVLAAPSPGPGRQQVNGLPRAIGAHGVHDLLGRGPGHRTAAADAVRLSGPGEQQPQAVVDLRGGAHRGARVPGQSLLVDRDRRRQALDAVQVRLVRRAQKLARVR